MAAVGELAGERRPFPFEVRSPRSTSRSVARVELPEAAPLFKAQALVFQAIGRLPAYYDPVRFPDSDVKGGAAPSEGSGGAGAGLSAAAVAAALQEGGGCDAARPPSMLREVLSMAPAQEGAGSHGGDEEARALALVNRADEAEAKGRHGEALELLREAYGVWDEAWLRAQHAARDERVSARRAENDAADAALAEAEAAFEAASAPPDEDDEEFAGYAAKRDREAAAAAADRARKEAQQAVYDAQAQLDEASVEPDLADRGRCPAELRAEVMVLLRMGAVAQTRGRHAEAVVTFWRAKESLDRLVQLHAQQRAARGKGGGGKGGGGGEQQAAVTLVHDTQLDLGRVWFDEVTEVEGAGADKDPVHLYHLSDPHPASGLVYSCLGAACYHAGRVDLALNCFNSSKTMRFQSISGASTEFVDVATSVNNMGVCLFHLGRPFAARFFFESALEVLETRLESVHPRVRVARGNLERMLPLVERATLASGSTVYSDALRALAAQGKPVSAPQWRVQLDRLGAAVHAAHLAAAKGGGKKKKGKKGKKKKK